MSWLLHSLVALTLLLLAGCGESEADKQHRATIERGKKGLHGYVRDYRKLAPVERHLVMGAFIDSISGSVALDPIFAKNRLELAFCTDRMVADGKLDDVFVILVAGECGFKTGQYTMKRQ